MTTRYFPHKRIKEFTIDFTVSSEASIERTVDSLSRIKEDDLRTRGYVPVLDISPSQSIRYNHENDTYEGVLTIYAVYVGERESWKIEGIEITNSGRVYQSSPTSPKMKRLRY